MGHLKLYNTRTRSIETFEPLVDGAVRIYVCGLTPSAEAHLGHARSFLFFDVLRRYLEHKGYRVTYVQNVTDIDDRSINRARETGENWYDIVSGYYASFKSSMQRLGVREPDFEPYATKYIDQICAMIGQLVERGHAYVAKDGVYYRVSSFPSYGALSNRNIEELEAGARIEVDETKDDPLDFALWKFVKPGEPHWPSPWGDGRPGWHIECSAMSRALLDESGDGFDIHGGGADLIFPHHENEVAQSEPLMAHPPMAKYWMHGGLLLFENQKMSKSLGNFEPLSELLKRHDPQAIRLLFLQTGYRKVMNFTEESVSAAAVTLERLKKMYRASTDGTAALRGSELIANIEKALDEDFNTSVALAEIVGYKGSNADEFAYALQLLGIAPDASWLEEPAAELPAGLGHKLGEALGTSFNGSSSEEAVAAVIALRTQARAEKNWAESDRLRDILLANGVALKDSKDGTTWSIAPQK
ncbi:MAG TPA: cysteine--tRNA ligase [Candidatus Baltobacteraceae bacterium]|nr:cysteine--tRNA ligase [Candidatus Baltobacteraceae bacterium]